MTRIDLLRDALSQEGVSVTRSDQIIHRIGTIVKRKRRAKIKPIDRTRQSVVDAVEVMTKRLSAFFASAKADLSQQIASALEALDKSSASDAAKKKVQAIVDDLDFSTWESLPSEIDNILIGVTKDGILAGFHQVGFAADHDIVDQVNKKAVSWARDRAAELVGMRYDEDGNLVENPDAEWAITESTRELLRDDIARAIEDGTSSEDFAAEIEDSYGFSADRAESIARTELAMADIEGSLIAYRDSGMVTGKEVVLGSDHDDEDECDEAAAMGVVPIDDDFDGLGDPPYHPKCVCDLLPVLATDE